MTAPEASWGEPVEVAYVAGLSHSGSTLLDQLIGSHSRAVSGGELKILSPHGRRRHGPASALPCSCGSDSVARCGFWRAVEAGLRSAGTPGLDGLDVYAKAPAVFERDNVALFRALRAAGGGRVVVDSSKDAGRLRRLKELRGLDVRTVHLSRSPFGVVYSEMRRGRPLGLHARRWVYVQRGVAALGGPRYAVRYESLVGRPRATLAGLMDWLGLGLEEGQLAWHRAELHNLGGNPRRFERTGRLQLDDEWRRGMSRLQKASVLTHLVRALLQPRARLGALLGATAPGRRSSSGRSGDRGAAR